MVARARRTGDPSRRDHGAVRLLGGQFVLGRTIDEALEQARPLARQGYRFSFDMLGEAAFTAADAKRYYDHYSNALDAIAREWPPRRRRHLRAAVDFGEAHRHPSRATNTIRRPAS